MVSRYITYYPAVEETNELMRVLRDYGLFRDEHKDFCEEMQRLRVLRGKAKERWEKAKDFAFHDMNKWHGAQLMCDHPCVTRPEIPPYTAHDHVIDHVPAAW